MALQGSWGGWSIFKRGPNRRYPTMGRWSPTCGGPYSHDDFYRLFSGLFMRRGRSISPAGRSLIGFHLSLRQSGFSHCPTVGWNRRARGASSTAGSSTSLSLRDVFQHLTAGFRGTHWVFLSQIYPFRFLIVGSSQCVESLPSNNLFRGFRSCHCRNISLSVGPCLYLVGDWYPALLTVL